LQDQKKRATITILNFCFVHFLESSDRLSPKLPVESSSSSLPSSSPPPPAASSQPSDHVINTNNSRLSTSETSSQRGTDETNNLTQRQRRSPSPTSDDASTSQLNHDENTKISKSIKQKKTTEHNEKYILSNDSKQRAQNLLQRLTQEMENRSKQSDINHKHPHGSFLGLQNYKDDQLLSQKSSLSSPDPYTNKLPPKSQRRSSSSLIKDHNPNDHTMTDDAS
jgi:hypothetical protein